MFYIFGGYQVPGLLSLRVNVLSDFFFFFSEENEPFIIIFSEKMMPISFTLV